MEIHVDQLLTKPVHIKSSLAVFDVIAFTSQILVPYQRNDHHADQIRNAVVIDLKESGYFVERSPIQLHKKGEEPMFAAWPIIRARKDEVQILVDIRGVADESDADIKKLALWFLEFSPVDQIYLAINLAFPIPKINAYFRKGFMGPEGGDACEIQFQISKGVNRS